MAGSSRIVLEIPPLPAIEVLLLIIAVILARGVYLMSEGMVILRRAAADGGLARLASSQKDADRSPPASRERRLSVDRSGPSTPEPRPARTVERSLKTSCSMFDACFLDEQDMDVGNFMDACRWYGDRVLGQMGNFTLIIVREIHANMDKVKHTYQLNPDKYRSMQALLEAECSSDMHQPGGVLSDPSAAMGLLWARRGLMFWVSLFRRHIDGVVSLKNETPTQVAGCS